MDETSKLKKLLWSTRRGMLELDLFLGPFARACYLRLEAKQQQHFAAFLELSDPELYAWLIQHQPPPPEWSALVGQLIDYRQTAWKR